ncbi:MAG: hypothetical protein JRF07_10655 [Deltaproteobacteria bacterium]|jgi:hypothetical protein|nr:hypothetical protein [Deltaproteobacteria bacterium]
MNDYFKDDNAVLPRLLASNALRANLSKHMTLNQMADHKASMIITAASLILTISVTQFDKLGLAMFLVMVLSSGSAILFSIFAIIPALHVKGFVNLFYFRSFAQVSEDQFIELFKETISDKDKLYDAYLREIYYLGKHRLTYKYRWISGGLWSLLFGLAAATIMTVFRFF